MPRPVPYRAALQWLLDNDDCTWLGDEPCLPPVTVALVADIWGKPEAEVVGALRRLWETQHDPY